jgi:hypothetical protein
MVSYIGIELNTYQVIRYSYSINANILSSKPFSGTYTYTPHIYMCTSSYAQKWPLQGHYTLPLDGKNLSVMNNHYESVETTQPFSSSNDEVEKNNMR